MSPQDIEKWLVVLGGLLTALGTLYKLIYQPIALAWKAREESIKRLESDLIRLRKERDEDASRTRTELGQSQTERAEASQRLEEALEKLDNARIEFSEERRKLQDEIARLQERNRTADEDRAQLREQIEQQAEAMERQRAIHEAELTRINDATARQLDNMRNLLRAAQAQIDSLTETFNAMKRDLDATKTLSASFESKYQECAAAVEKLAENLEYVKEFLRDLGLKDAQIDAIAMNHLTVVECKTDIIAKLTRKDTGPLPPLPEIQPPPTVASDPPSL